MRNDINDKWFLVFLLTSLLAFRSLALVVTDYNSVTNNRFVPEGDYTNTIANPSYVPTLNTNAAFIGYGYDFSGVGWDSSNYVYYGDTLIGPQTDLVAWHAQVPNDKMFFGRNGQMLDAGSAIYSSLGNDVGIGTHSRYTPSSKAAIYPVMDLGANPANYIGSPLIMYGWYSKVGTNYVTGANSSYFYYSAATNAPDMAYVEGGDSSSPDFIPYVDPITGAKKLSVIGAHYFYGGDPFLPAYWTNINAIMNPTGYSLRWVAPVAQTWTGGAGSGDFTNSANWSLATPGISNAVLFDVGTAGGQTVINLGGTQTLNGLYFKNSGGNGFTISNGLLAVDRVGIVNGSNGTLVIQSDVAFNAPQNWDGGNGGITVNGNITNNGYLFYMEGTGTNRLNGAIYGAGGLAKDGTGRLIVSGTNILGGSVFVHEGTLELASPFLSSTDSLYVSGSLLLQGGTNIFGGSLYGGNVEGLVGDVSLKGGLLVVSNGIRIGTQAGSTGSFTVNGGRLETASLFVGDGGVGTMTVSNGTWLPNQVNVGNNAGSQGTLTFDGGTNLLSNILYVGNAANATGAVLLTGGQLATTNNAVSVGNSGVGGMTVSNGTWLASQAWVGNNAGSRGALNIAGGTNLLSSFLAVGFNGNATGAVLVTGGQLVTTNSDTFLGDLGVGTMTVSNGTWLANQMWVGYSAGSRGTLNIAGGTNLLLGFGGVGVNAASATGAVLLTGGQLVTTNNIVSVGNSGVGSMTVSNGTWLASQVWVGANAGSQGGLTLDGGTSLLSGGLAVGNAAGSTGNVTIAGSGILELLSSITLGSGLATLTNRDGGTLRFMGQNDPTVTKGNGSLVVTNAIVEFKNASAANLLGNITNITVQAGSTLQLNSSTNASMASYTIDNTGAGNYMRLVLTGSNSLWQGTALTIGSGGSLIVTNAVGASVASALTNLGTILFSGGSSLGFGGSALTLNGMIGFHGVTNAVSVAGIPGMAYAGNNTLLLESSTNISVASYTFDSAVNTGNATNYSALILSGINPLWQSTALTIGSGGSLLVTNAVGAGVAATVTNNGLINIASGTSYRPGTVSVAAGSGVLHVDSGGVLELTNGAFTVGNTVTNLGTILFSGGGSLSFGGSALTLNGVIGFRGSNAVSVAGIPGMAYAGNNTLLLESSTNISVASYTFDSAVNTGNATNYSALILSGINPLWQSTALTIGAGGSLLVTNAVGARVTAAVTNNGLINIVGGSSVFSGGVVDGSNSGATGSVLMTGGQFVTTNSAGSSTVFVGNSAAGVMTVSDGVWLGNNVTVGNNAGSQGALTLAGGSNLLSSALAVGNNANATGAVWLTGGQLVTTNNAVLVGNGGIGSVTVSNGMWLASQEWVGNNAGSQGTLTLTGGTNLLSSFLAVGFNGNATGAVLMTGGQLVTTNSDTFLGDLGVGTMTVSNGTWMASQEWVGYNAGSQGALSIAGGANLLSSFLSVGANANATGAILVTGGQLVTTNGNVTMGDSGVGNMTVSNGAWLANGVNVGNATGSRGTLALAGGISLLSGGLTVGGAAGSTGSVTIAGSGILELRSSITLGSGLAALTNRDGGTLRFTGQNNPTITRGGGSFVVTNAIVEFKNASAANLQGNITNITVLAGSTLQLNSSTNAALASYAVGSGNTFAEVGLVGTNSTWLGGALVVGAGGALNVSNAAGATVGAAVTATGDIRVVNSRVTWQSNVVVSGRYFSDPSTNIFATNVTVTASGALSGSNGDLFVFQQNFTMQSTNRTDYNLALASVLFTNASAGPTNHIFDLTGSGAVDMGSNWLTAAQLATNFSIGTLSLAGGNSLTLNGVLLSNALSVGWLDLGGSTNNITSRLGLNVNLY